jgi:hypothetical protein
MAVSDSIFAGVTAGAQFGVFCPMERFSPVLSRCILCGTRRVPTGAGREKRSESIRHSTTVGAVSGEAGAAFVFFGPCFLATLDAFDALGILTDASGCVFSTMENRPFHGKTACSPNRPATRWRNCEGMKRA